MCIEAARQSHDERGEQGRKHHVPKAGDADGPGEQLVLTDGLHGPPDGAVFHAVQTEQRQHDQQQDEVEVRDVSDEPPSRRRHRGNPHRAVGHVDPVEGDEAKAFCETECDEYEIGSPQPQRQAANDPAGNCRRQTCSKERDREGHVVPRRENRRHIGAQSIERHRPERQETHLHQDVVGGREQDEYAGLDRQPNDELIVDDVGKEQRCGQQSRKHIPRRSRQGLCHRLFKIRPRLSHHASFCVSFPSRPVGLTTSTTMIKMNAIASRYPDET